MIFTSASLRIGIDPTFEVGPLSLAWHGIFTAVGLAVGLTIASRLSRRRGLDPDVTAGLVLLAGAVGIVGARVLYLIEHGEIGQPGEWLGTNGFSFYGALFAVPPAVIAYLRVKRLSLEYLDVLAWAFPLASAVGRIGDLINGEHYGPPTDAPWGIRYTHPDAGTPDPTVAYHAGGLYEVVLGLLVAALMWALRSRLTARLAPLWAAIGLYSAGRVVMFGWRSDSPDALWTLDSGQLLSVALVVISLIGYVLAQRSTPRPIFGR